MKKFSPVVGIFLILLSSLLWITPTLAAGGPPPGGPPGGGRGCGDRPGQKPCPPVAQVGVSKTTVVPEKLTAGQPMTYTIHVEEDPDKYNLVAYNTSFTLPFVGDQQLVSFVSTTPGWHMRGTGLDSSNNLVVDLGTVRPGDDGTFIVGTIFATNYSSAIYETTMHLDWNDAYGQHTKGASIKLDINIPPPAVTQPIPDPPRTLPSPPTTAPGTPVTSGPFAVVANPGTPNNDASWFFPATGHTLHGAFLKYWLSHGSLIVLGYPLSEEYSDNGRIIQYFERVVMEYWPENQAPYNVLLRSLGRELSQVNPPIAAGTPAPFAGSVFYAQTGHWLDGRFVKAWLDGGGLAQYGFPIQEPQVVDGKLVQWTERARFELDLSRPNQLVMLGLLGDESAQQKKFIS